ncbi:MAG: GNAT family N-acetyltransferase [Actinomycetota bacterium]|nr:GNAT family N-acetyltransferase [Actinomycetota bacterium]
MTTPPDLRIVRLSAADHDEVLRLDQAAFAFDPAMAAEATERLEWDRAWAAVRPAAGPHQRTSSTAWGADEELAGQYLVYTLDLAAPGFGSATRRVPMAGLTWVAVHPDHRRRGVLTELIRHHLDGLHEEGLEPISGLFASEAVIYQRFGYGGAAPAVRLTIPSGTRLRPLESATGVQTQLHEAAADPALAELADQVFVRSSTRPGWVSRPPAATHYLLRDRPELHRGSEPKKVLVATSGAQPDGGMTGYAVLRRTAAWKDGAPNGTVEVLELVGTDAPTLHALWSRVLGFDLMAEVQVPLVGPDDPLLAWVEDPRSMASRRTDALWLRLVDVDRALVARGYAHDLDVVLDVHDELCPWNARRWRLAVAGEQVGCEPTSGPADVTLDVRDLAAAYLGGPSIASLAAAGIVVEERAGAVAALSSAMRGLVEPGVPPMF